jgi:hypothetical protein
MKMNGIRQTFRSGSSFLNFSGEQRVLILFALMLIFLFFAACLPAEQY